MKYLILFLAGLLLISCDSSKSTAPATPRTPGSTAVEPREVATTYTCRGNEPFWAVDIKEGNITFRTPDEGPIAYPYQVPQQRGSQKEFTSKAGSSSLRVVIKEEPCTDTMSGEPFPYTVEVTRDGKIYSGCGK